MSGTDGIMNLLEAGMRAEGLRQKAIASNVANMATPGYRTVDVKFEELLAKALESPETGGAESVVGELVAAKNTTVKENGNDVAFEVEVGKMVKNSAKYEVYIRLAAKKYQQMDMAMATGM